MSDDGVAKIVFAIVICLLSIPVWVAGASYGRYCCQLEAVKSGCAKYAVDEEGRAQFEWSKP